MRTLATKQQTEAEIQDEIEWMLNEYAKAMQIHRIQVSTGSIEAYLIPGIELLEDIAKFNWSKIAKGKLTLKRRRLELLDAEMKAPGQECAYVFDAREKFGLHR